MSERSIAPPFSIIRRNRRPKRAPPATPRKAVSPGPSSRRSRPPQSSGAPKNIISSISRSAESISVTFEERSALKIGFVSLGCPKNLVDTEVMMGQLTSSGHELTPHPSDADVIVVNTCSFIDPAKQESVDTILEMAEYKKTGRAQRLIVAGCLVERHRGEIQKNIPEVDAVIGTNELERITALCEGVERRANPLEAYLYHDLPPRVLSTPKHYAYIKI